MKRLVRDLAWRHCIRRQFRTSCFRLNDDRLSPSINAKKLLKALVPPEQIPSKPSSLNALTQADLQSPFSLSPTPDHQVEKPLAAKPVPAGHNVQIYREVAALAKEGTDPTPQQLTELFRMMEFDSPEGEMKDEAFAIWQEMRSRGVIPTREGYVALLKLVGKLGDVLKQEEVVHSLWEDKVPLTEVMTHHLIEGLIRNHEIDRAIFLFRDLRARKLYPRLRMYNLIISVCVDYVEPEEAFRTLMDLKETYGEESVPDRHWWRVLELCAKEGYLLGTLHCWQKIQIFPQLFISEGLCLNVLSTAARNGHPALATSVFDALSTLEIPFCEYHFLPLIEAYVRCGDIRQAFIVISVMRESCLSPPQTLHLSFLIKEIGKSAQNLDRAFFILQDIVQKEGKSIDIVAFNCLLSACIHLKDASRAISTYRDAASLKVQPNIETFNLLLHAAQLVGHIDLAMYILSDLKTAQITPNADTYARVILTYLAQPGTSYDQAFIYLEEMKASGHIPSPGIYSTFVKKCVYSNDDRAMTILEEMKRVGYNVKHLERYVRNATKNRGGSKLLARELMGEARREEGEASQKMFKMVKEWKKNEVQNTPKM